MIIEIYGKDGCSFCTKAHNLAKEKSREVTYKRLGVEYTKEEFESIFPNVHTVPQIFIDGLAIGGYRDLQRILA